MNFLTPAFVRVNNPEKRKELDRMATRNRYYVYVPLLPVRRLEYIALQSWD